MNSDFSSSSGQKQFFNAHQTDLFSYGKNVPYARYMIGKLMKYVPLRGARILEVGAGQGRFTLELARYASRVTAIDIADRSVEALRLQLRRRKIPTVSAAVHDLLTVAKTLPKHEYDVIVGVLILHHLPKDQLRLVVHQLKAYLKPGGRFCFLEPNCLYPFYLVAMAVRPNMKWEYERGTYTNFMSVFVRACQEEGLLIRAKSRFGFFPPPVINRWSWITAADGFIEHLPILRAFLCPFILVAAQKPARVWPGGGH